MRWARGGGTHPFRFRSPRACQSAVSPVPRSTLPSAVHPPQFCYGGRAATALQNLAAIRAAEGQGFSRARKCCGIIGYAYKRRTKAGRKAILECNFILASDSISDSCATHMGAPPEQFQGGAGASPGQYQSGRLSSKPPKATSMRHQSHPKAC